MNQHTNDKKLARKILFVSLLAFSVMFAFIQFIQDNNRRAVSISVKSLQDATVQSGLQIDVVFEGAKNELVLMAALYAEMLEDSEIDAKDLKKFEETASFDHVEFTSKDGIDLNSEGKTAEVSDRDYFRKGMNGNSGVDMIFNSRITHENLIIFYTPLYFNSEIKGVLTGCYREEKMQEIIYSTFFGEEARTFLTLPDGTIVASSNKGYIAESIFDERNFNRELAPDVVQELKEALLAGEEYQFQYDGSNGTGNAYVTPLGNSNWMLIQTYPSGITSQFVRNANTAGILLLAELVGIFIVSLIVTQVTGWIQKKKLMIENTEKSYVVDGITNLFKIFILIDFEQDTYRYLAGTRPREAKYPIQGDYDSLRKFFTELMVDEEERESLSLLLRKESLQENMDEGTKQLRYEYRIRYNEVKWVGINLICLKRVDGVPTEVLLTYQDVTKLKEQEQRSYEALKEAYQAVESANLAKSNFLSSMSHDIRTPMNAIMGMTAIAAMNIENQERVKDCLNKITISSQHLLGLINEVLDMSKIESGKLIFAEEEFNLSDVVENIVTMFLPQTQAKNQKFDVSIANITHEEIIGDSMRLQQVFVNILGNAVKFTPEGGKILFSICEKPSNMHGCGCYVFTFEDTGIGMEEGFIDKMFEPFSRAKDSRTNSIEGTGLGMPIVKNLVQMMNGDIQVESKLNEGSKFTVTVYLQLNHFKQDNVEGLEDLTVLVADDDRFACENACSVLKEIGMEADWVLSGEEAVTKLVEAHNECKDYSAVILDWKMPGMDGVETAREIRTKIGDEVPIIILSAFDYASIEQEAREAGVNAFITKPLFRSRLIYIMKSLILREEEKSTEIEQLQSKDYSDRRVLLVEDIELNMEIANEMLTQSGVSVDKAMNGRLAVERVNEMPAGYYNLIFMDIHMPEMNGYEATEAIRASEREDLKTIPIIAMTADAFTDDVKRAKDAGMNGHIAKPIEIKKLLQALDEWL